MSSRSVSPSTPNRSESPSPKRPRLSSASPDADPPAESGVNLDETYRHGNFTVVTADKVTFRINDFLLFAYSPVLAEAYSLAPDDRRLVLTDDELESAEIFRLFLQTITTLKYSRQLPSGFPQLDKLLLFLDKWESTAIFNLVFDTVMPKFTRRLSDVVLSTPLQYFHLASRHGRADVCIEILWRHPRHSKHDKWWNQDLSPSPYDPRGWTLRFWEENAIPPKYLHALVQAFHASEERGGFIEDLFPEALGYRNDG